VTAKVFIPLLIATLFAFGFFIAWVSRKLSGNIEQRPFNVITGILIAMILGGVFGMFQPWNMDLYSLGFKLVLIGTLAFTVWSHVTPRLAAAVEAIRSDNAVT
jgi:quinol-cytochrome oxidoreductase complex cytochrome b subunit